MECRQRGQRDRERYRWAHGLLARQREQLRHGARSYVDVVLERDWQAMANDNIELLESSLVNQQLWEILMSVKAAEPTELTLKTKQHSTN